jgi:flagellar motility protein MotE (MotC chaperone)
MTCPRLLQFLAVFLAASASLAALKATPSLAWGWKEEEGTGAIRQPAQQPATSSTHEKKRSWNPAVVATPPVEPAATAEQPEAPKPEMLAPGPAKPADAPVNVKAYCENIADQALDARFLVQKAELARLEEELTKRTAMLEAKKAEYQEWLKRRDEFISKAEGSLVKLYTKIKPDAAAPQLAAMDEEAAAALLLKLSPKASSAILDQMETGKAARLVSVIIGAAKPDRGAAPERSPAPSAPAGTPPEASAGPPPDGRKS